MLTHARPFQLSLCLLALCTTTLARAQGLASGQTDESPWTSLFDGKTLEGWYGNNPHQTARVPQDERRAFIESEQTAFEQHWTARDGVLVNDGKGPYATTIDEYENIELHLEYKTVAGADSGIYLRGTPQVQIWDSTEAGGKWERGANFGSGGLFNNRRGNPGQLPLRLADKPFGEWNQVRILQIGSRTWVEWNHQLVVDGAIMENFWDKERLQPLARRGPIHLQTHGGEILWRNIRLREISHDEAISRLRGDDAKYGFQSIFNGTDLTGWTGAVEDYEVVGKALQCKTGRGGVLFTEKQYANFAARLEFKLPPGGNNGLAIRYPGQGRAAYDGMCELQVLDDDADKYASLDPRQYHGSVYGIAPAQRGYLFPPGEWNYQEVRVDGTRIQVELNGTLIVDADVEGIRDYKDGAAHPGKLLTTGHFGFAGHNDPVQFRNIAIKELPASKSNRDADIDRGLIFEANFQDVTDANLSTHDGFLLGAKSTKRKVEQDDFGKVKIQIEPDGLRGDALRFSPDGDGIVYYPGNEVNYSARNWSGSVSFWLQLDPNKDLAPGFCDPIQITTRTWNDGALWVDFDKELPRDFRLGVFSDLAHWNPDGTEWDAVPPGQRPTIVVENPPFASDKWTHVCFTWERINAEDNAPSEAKLYLDGELQGTINQPIQITWEPDNIAMMIGIHYVGLMDELRCYDRALSQSDVEALYQAR